MASKIQNSTANMDRLTIIAISIMACALAGILHEDIDHADMAHFIISRTTDTKLPAL